MSREGTERGRDWEAGWREDPWELVACHPYRSKDVTWATPTYLTTPTCLLHTEQDWSSAITPVHYILSRIGVLLLHLSTTYLAGLEFWYYTCPLHT